MDWRLDVYEKSQIARGQTEEKRIRSHGDKRGGKSRFGSCMAQKIVI